MKSILQKGREHMRESVYVSDKPLSSIVKCPKCKSKMERLNLEKYGKCYTCSMKQKYRK